MAERRREWPGAARIARSRKSATAGGWRHVSPGADHMVASWDHLPATNNRRSIPSTRNEPSPAPLIWIVPGHSPPAHWSERHLCPANPQSIPLAKPTPIPVVAARACWRARVSVIYAPCFLPFPNTSSGSVFAFEFILLHPPQISVADRVTIHPKTRADPPNPT